MSCWSCLHVALGLDLPLGELRDLLVVSLPDKVRALVHLAGLEGQNNVARLLVHRARHFLGSLSQNDQK